MQWCCIDWCCMVWFSGYLWQECPHAHCDTGRGCVWPLRHFDRRWACLFGVGMCSRCKCEVSLRRVERQVGGGWWRGRWKVGRLNVCSWWDGCGRGECVREGSLHLPIKNYVTSRNSVCVCVCVAQFCWSLSVFKAMCQSLLCVLSITLQQWKHEWNSLCGSAKSSHYVWSGVALNSIDLQTIIVSDVPFC